MGKTRLAIAVAVLGLAVGPTARGWAQESLGIGKKLVPPGATLPEPGPKGKVHELTIPKEGNMIADGLFECWVPDGGDTIRCIIVHLHGCTRERDAKPLMSDLQWKTLAKKWNAVFMCPSFNTGPGNQTCSNWSNLANGSEKVFLAALEKLAETAHRPEIKTVPWVLWGHSGGAFWITSMTARHPERVAVAVAQSGCRELGTNEAALKIPILHHNGRQDILNNTPQFIKGRSLGALWAYAVNPDTETSMDGHQCHDLRMLCIPWIDACLELRLGKPGDAKLRDLNFAAGYLGDRVSKAIAPVASFNGDPTTASWFPTRLLAEKWIDYMNRGTIRDLTPPPAPTDLTGSYADNKITLTWNADADLESGIKTFVIYRNGTLETLIRYANRSLYSSTMGYQRWNDGDQPAPSPAPPMVFADPDVKNTGTYVYEVATVNWSDTVGPRSAPITLKDGKVIQGNAP
jgi:predicted esterase